MSRAPARHTVVIAGRGGSPLAARHLAPRSAPAAATAASRAALDASSLIARAPPRAALSACALRERSSLIALSSSSARILSCTAACLRALAAHAWPSAAAWMKAVSPPAIAARIPAPAPGLNHSPRPRNSSNAACSVSSCDPYPRNVARTARVTDGGAWFCSVFSRAPTSTDLPILIHPHELSITYRSSRLMPPSCTVGLSLLRLPP